MKFGKHICTCGCEDFKLTRMVPRDVIHCSRCGKILKFASDNDRKMFSAKPVPKVKTFGDIFHEACIKLNLHDVADYRPAVPMHVSELNYGIPGGIIIWLKDGSKIIYIAQEGAE